MIFETDKFEFEIGKSGKLEATNGFIVKYKCNKEDCIIEYGYDNEKLQIAIKNNNDAEQFIIKLIKTNVIDKNAKISKIVRGKSKTSQFLSIMENLI